MEGISEKDNNTGHSNNCVQTTTTTIIVVIVAVEARGKCHFNRVI